MQKIDPFYIDINLASSVDLLANVSDYVSLLQSFPDESVINNMLWHCDSHSDPMTSKITFFKELNNNKLKTKEAQHGAVKSKTTDIELQNKNYRDQIPRNAIIKTGTGNRYDKPALKGETEVEATINTTEKTWISDGEGSEANGRWETITTSTDVTYPVEPLLDIQKTPPELQDEFGMKDMSPWFILWWMEKFYTAHEIVRDDLKEVLGEENEYFVSFSESVGQLKNIRDAYDTATLPIWDTQVAAYGDEYSPPTVTAGVVKYCMNPESLALAQQLSKQTNTIFRKNLAMMMEDASRDELIPGIMPSFSNQSHGNNFVSDNLHPSRMTKFVGTVREVIQDHLKGLYDVLELLSNRENYIVVGKPRQILLKVEKFTVAVDLFKNKIRSYDLERNDKSFSNYGKGSTYNTNTTNSSRLGI